MFRTSVAFSLIILMAIPALAASATFELPEALVHRYGNYLDPVPAAPVFVDTQMGRERGIVVDPYLGSKLAASNDSDVLDLIVQFKGVVQPGDRAYLEALGFEILYEYSVIPGMHCKGVKSAVLELSENPRVFWIEYNEPLQWLMHGTTTVINATKVWDSDILSPDGQNEGRIDGTGVTAVVLDSGIDAGHPDLDYKTKTIMNLKSDTGEPPWVEMENSDTSSGHGTHCAGTVAGNGDASGGSRRGVAPGANLIGLSVGELFFITGPLGGLDWVYDHSRPGANPYNIRVVSNSWGSGGGEYDPQDSISQASERIVYENNVIVTFAAGNSGGTGSDIQSSNYGNAPANICVAALEHDGGGVAEFSSRGQADLNGTWPDIGAPGVKIWSTAARRTLISTMTKQNHATDFNPYYFAISGTSMATPHISGVVSLLWQAYPGMRLSYTHDDYNGADFPDWYNMSNTRVHEVELILEASGEYIWPNGDNGVPDNFTLGWDDKPHDFAQGFGMVQVDRAIAIALTLKELRTRDFDLDGSPDYPNASVQDALKQYNNIMVKNNMTEPTNTLESGWKGEWVRFNNQTTNPVPMYTDESHYFYIPQNAKTMTLTLDYVMYQTQRPQLGTLSLVIDLNGDGQAEWSQPLSIENHKVDELDLSSGEFASARGSVWNFNIEGHGIILPILNILRESQYYEARIPYTASAVVVLDQTGSPDSSVDFKDLHAAYGQWEFTSPSEGYTNGTVTMERYQFDLSKVHDLEPPPQPKKEETSYLWLGILLILALIAAVAVGYGVYRHRQKKAKG